MFSRFKKQTAPTPLTDIQLFTIACQTSTLNVVKMMLQPPVAAYIKNLFRHFENDSPLVIACVNGDVPLLKLLKESNVCDFEFQISEYAIKTQEIDVRHLPSLPIKQVLLDIALYNKQEKIVLYLLENVFHTSNDAQTVFGSINIQGERFFRILCSLGLLKSMKFLFSDINIDDEFNAQRILNESCSNQDLPMVNYLLSNIKVDIDAFFGLATPLHMACLNGNYAIVDLLLKKGCKTNTYNHTLGTPLHAAIQNQHLHIVKRLIEEPTCDIFFTEGYYRLPISFAEDMLKQATTPERKAGAEYIIKLLKNSEQFKYIKYKTFFEKGHSVGTIVFMFAVLLSDRYFNLKQEPNINNDNSNLLKLWRFLNIMKDLPQELQMLVGNRADRSMRKFIPASSFNEALKDFIPVLHSLPQPALHGPT
jgi:ankyrin repeat protein